MVCVMSFEYIECPEGQEQGPAIEDVAPYCMPADEAMPGDGPMVGLPAEVVPEPSVPESPLPEISEPVLLLAETGLSINDVLTYASFACILVVVGWFAWKASRRF